MLLQNFGCHGGRADWAWYKVMQNGGAATEKQYPYRAKKGTCQVSTSTSFAMLNPKPFVTMLLDSSWSDYTNQ